jgi:hypothetical protein
MKYKKTFFVILTTFITITAVAFVYSNIYKNRLNNTFQEPQYILEARKNIVGVWYQKDNPTIWVEYTISGTEHMHGEGYDKISDYKIVNTTPICGEDVEVDEGKETMYLQCTSAAGDELCQEIISIDDKQLNLSPVGPFSPQVTIYLKK